MRCVDDVNIKYSGMENLYLCSKGPLKIRHRGESCERAISMIYLNYRSHFSEFCWKKKVSILRGKFKDFNKSRSDPKAGPPSDDCPFLLSGPAWLLIRQSIWRISQISNMASLFFSVSVKASRPKRSHEPQRPVGNTSRSHDWLDTAFLVWKTLPQSYRTWTATIVTYAAFRIS